MIQAISPPSFNALGYLNQILWKKGGTPPQCYNEIKSPVLIGLEMDKIYYQPNHLWKGKKAIRKLKEYSKEKPKVVKQWLSQQAYWQVHLLAPK